jgi:hypothetical protein
MAPATLTSKRFTAHDEADAIEQAFAKGWSDGLPVVPPTEARVRAMLDAARLQPGHQVAFIRDRAVAVTAEKVAINAVMAGCRPEYAPVVVAALRALCRPEFAYHGPASSTGGSAMVLIVNGPIARRLEINSGNNALGQGHRANATIGRAVRLVWGNIGGARPGDISMSTFAQAGRYTYCIGEREEESPWEPLHVEHGFAPADSTVAALAAEAPQVVVDARSRTARDILTTVARSGESIANHTQGDLSDTLLVIAPEHARTIAADGWSKQAVREFVWERARAEVDGVRVPKFRTPANVKIVVAGGTAGRFSAWIPGWPFPGAPSSLVLKAIASR